MLCYYIDIDHAFFTSGFLYRRHSLIWMLAGVILDMSMNAILAAHHQQA